MTPSYSIIIPVYQRVFGFRESLESALAVAQCSEVIVVDDASDHQEFAAIVDALNDGRVKYYRNTANLGLFGNWNRGIELAQSDFVSVLCSDDSIEPHAYEEFAKAYRVNPQLDVFFGPFCTFSNEPDSRETHRVYPPGPTAAADLMADAIENGPVFPVLTIIRRSTSLRLPFVAKPHSGNDWLWIYGNAAALNLHATDRPINHWRRHADQDAEKSRSITTDCWPLMFKRMELQLRELGHPLANKALRRAKGVILTWLLNDYDTRAGYFPRLLAADARNHMFLRAALEIADKDWILSNLLKPGARSAVFNVLGRAARKSGFYLHS